MHINHISMGIVTSVLKKTFINHKS